MLTKNHGILAAIATLSLAGAAWAAVQEPPRPMPPPPPAGETMFERLDANHDGVIDRAEFDAVRERIGRRMRGEFAPEANGRRPNPEENSERPRQGPNRGRFWGAPMAGPRAAMAAEEIKHVIRGAVNEALRDHPPELREHVQNAVIEALKHQIQKRTADGRDGRGPGEPGLAPPAPSDNERPKGPPPPLGGPQRPGQRPQRHMGPDNPDADGMAPKPGDRADRQGRRRGGRGQDDGMNERPGRFRDPQNQNANRNRGQGAGQNPQQKFKQMDVNGDGYLTQDEFKGGAERFAMMDSNNDGKLSKKEVREAMRRFRDKRNGNMDEGANKQNNRGQKRDRNARRVVI